jgi:hypothetical protein
MAAGLGSAGAGQERFEGSRRGLLAPPRYYVFAETVCNWYLLDIKIYSC